MDLKPSQTEGSQTPLLMRSGILARNSFIGFDSTLAMLRSVCAAQESGVIRYNEGFIPAEEPGGLPTQPNEILYDVKELWDVIRPFNPRADYWPKAIDGSIDWDEIEVEPSPTPWKVQMSPEASRIMFLSQQAGQPDAMADAEDDEAALNEPPMDPVDDPGEAAMPPETPLEIAWVLSEGGPYLVVPEEGLGDWRGVEDWSGTLDDPTDQSDYARACRSETRIGAIACGARSALILSDDSGPVAWFGDEDGRGGVLIQDRQATDTTVILALIESGNARQHLADGTIEELVFETGPSGGLRLIDAADCGAALQTASVRIRLQAGRYRVRAGDLETADKSLIIRDFTYRGPSES